MQVRSRRFTNLIFGLVGTAPLGFALATTFAVVTTVTVATAQAAEDDSVPMLPAPTATPTPANQVPPQAAPPAKANAPAAATSSSSRVVSITKVVGEVGDQFVTSREVKINSAIEQALNKKTAGPGEDRHILAGNERFFPAEVTRVLDEWAVYFEARALGSTSVQKAEVAKAVGTVEESWTGHPGWKELEVGQDELRRMIERKLAAEEFQKLKSDPSMSPVSDEEALAYYKKNRLRFGSLPFSSFQENIKAFLVKTQVEKRLSEWHEVLRRKYKTRNFISG
jgi:hypothetical protein